MTRRRRAAGLLAGAVVVALLSLARSTHRGEPALPAEQARTALTDLALAIGHVPPGPHGWKRNLSLRDLANEARTVDLELEQVEVPFETLPDLPGPVLTFEHDPPAAVVYLQRDGAQMQRVVAGDTDVLAAAVLRSRYGGRVLRPAGLGEANVILRPLEAEVEAAGIGRSAAAHFEIENRSEATVALMVVDTSCDCTVPSLAQREVLPGDVTDVTVRIEPQQVGRVEHHVVLGTDCPAWPRLTLPLHIVVPEPVRLRPDRVTLRLPADAGVPPRVRLTGPGDAELVTIAPSAPWLHLDVEPEPRSAEVAEWRLYVRCDELPAGEHRATARIMVSAAGEVQQVELVVVVERS